VFPTPMVALPPLEQLMPVISCVVEEEFALTVNLSVFDLTPE